MPGKREITSRRCAVFFWCTTPAALHPERDSSICETHSALKKKKSSSSLPMHSRIQDESCFKLVIVSPGKYSERVMAEGLKHTDGDKREHIIRKLKIMYLVLKVKVDKLTIWSMWLKVVIL